MFYRLHQLEPLGMIHLEKVAILNALHLKRRRSFCLGIALVAVTPRSKRTQNRSESEDSGYPALHGITSRPTARFNWFVAFR